MLPKFLQPKFTLEIGAVYMLQKLIMSL